MTIAKKLSFCFVLYCFVGVAVAQDANKGIIAGQLMIKGGAPLAGGSVFLFNDASGPPPSQFKYWRVPDYIARIDQAGKFFIELPAGKYYLGAIKRTSGEKIGPPEDGDYFVASSDERGLPKAYVVEAGKKIELGAIAEAAPFQKKAVMPGYDITAIEGQVFDTEGKALAGALVLAQVAPLNAGRRPLFTSERTDKDGRYVLKVSDGGNYFLRVRSMQDKGPPIAGEMIGVYGGKEPLAVAITKGQVIHGIDITVVRYRGRESDKEQRSRINRPSENNKASN